MEEVISGLLDPVIIGTVALFVFLTVQGLKVYGLVTEGSEGKLALGSAGVAGVLLALAVVWAPAAPFVTMGIRFYVGALVGGLFYKYIAKPVVEAFVGNITTDDLK